MLCAALCFGLVVPFTLVVLGSGRVGIVDYALLTSKFVGLAIGLGATAFMIFAGTEVISTGLRSRWRSRPATALQYALKARWDEDRLFSLAWPIVLFMLLLPAFNAYKQLILSDASFRFDPMLAAADRAVFGTDPGLLLHQWIGSTATTHFFDAIYHGWFVPTTLGICIVSMIASTRTRAQFMLAYTSVWLLMGALGAWLMPAAGPGFYAAVVGPDGAEGFERVTAALALAGQTEFVTSLSNQRYLLANHANGVLVVGGGISAMPSIHNALAVLFALVSFRFHRGLGAAMTLFAALIWIGSVYLNWHYMLDGLIGGAGAAAIWFGSGKVVAALLEWPGARCSQLTTKAL